jgi:hypothetical protein
MRRGLALLGVVAGRRPRRAEVDPRMSDLGEAGTRRGAVASGDLDPTFARVEPRERAWIGDRHRLRASGGERGDGRRPATEHDPTTERGQEAPTGALPRRTHRDRSSHIFPAEATATLRPSAPRQSTDDHDDCGVQTAIARSWSVTPRTRHRDRTSAEAGVSCT